MSSHVFTLEAIAECEREGHRWRWVRSWHEIGCHECWRCGATGPVSEGKGEAPARAASGSDREQSGTPALAVAGLDSQAVHQVRVGPGQRQPRRSPSPRAEADATAGETATHPTALARERSVRDAEIVRRFLAGEKRVDLAREFGLHLSRIYQLCWAGRKPPKTRKPPPNGAATAARNAEIVRRRLAGEKPSLLAAEFGVHPSRIPQIVHEAERRGIA